MARDFASFLASAAAYRAPLLGQPSRFNAPIAGELRTVPVSIQWSEYFTGDPGAAVLCDVGLSSGASRQPLDAIRSVIIDNTFSPVPVYVYFGDTQTTIPCPPNSYLVAPATTGQFRFTVFIEGLSASIQPYTVVHVTNDKLPPILIDNPYSAPAQGRINGAGSGFFNPALSSFSLSGSPLGNEDPSRIVALAVIAGVDSGTGALVLNSITIDGQPMLQANQAHANSGATVNAAIFYLPWPTGTTANYTFTYSAGVEMATVVSYSLYRVNNAAPSNIASSQGARINRSINMIELAGSVSIKCGGAADVASPFAQPVWGGSVFNPNGDFMDDNSLAPPYYWFTSVGTTTAVEQVYSTSLNTSNVLIGACWR